MLVDLAHINRRGFLDACQVAKKPPIVSHTGVLGAFEHWRNIDDEQLDGLVERLDLADLFDTWTSSESAGSCKPDARIYQVALGAAGCEARQVLFVGDTVEHDIVGPRTQGMRTALLLLDDRPGASDGGADYVIDRLGEVVELVDAERAA